MNVIRPRGGVQFAPVVAVFAFAAIALSCGDPTTPERTDATIVFSLDTLGPSGYDLYFVRNDGTPIGLGNSRDGTESVPSWSPDGRHLAFYHEDFDGSGVWLADGDGRNAHLVPLLDDFYFPRWSPDGAWIFSTVTDGAGGIDIQAAHPDGSGRHSLTPGISNVALRAATWSRHGRIAFKRGFGGDIGTGNLWTINADGSGLRQLTTGARDEDPVWSPDGNMIAFSGGGLPAASGVLAVMNADGSGLRVIADESRVADYHPDAWSPDGKWLLLRRLQAIPRACAYYKVSVAGGPLVRVSRDAYEARCGGASWR